MEINSNTWVSMITGIPESQLIYDIKAGKTIEIHHSLKGVAKGDFNTLSINELRHNTKIAPAPRSRFTIYTRKTTNSNNNFFDTSALQTILKSKRNVMFQVASNFNCHENGSNFTNLFSGNFLTNQMSDSTQGPSASAGAGAGAILRLERHFKYPINLLEDLPMFEVDNGKLVDYDVDEILKADHNEVKIGLHTDVTANFDRSYSRKFCRFTNEGAPLIDQVYVSTNSMDNISAWNTPTDDAEEQLVACRFLLKAAYTGTYLAARARGTEKLVLTLIGGGVFHNPVDEIYWAIAENLVQNPVPSLEEVILPLYDAKNRAADVKQSLIDAGYPASLITIEEH